LKKLRSYEEKKNKDNDNYMIMKKIEIVKKLEKVCIKKFLDSFVRKVFKILMVKN
jgi:hypothetical protein